MTYAERENVKKLTEETGKYKIQGAGGAIEKS
jgi:hypothetical protein